MTDQTDLYRTDYYAWAHSQADALREMARLRMNTPLDLDNLAEEVADLAAGQRDAVRSHLRRIIEHCLKLEFSIARDPRNDWRASIDHARAEIGDKLTATLQRDVQQDLPLLFSQGRRQALHGLRKYGEAEAIAALPTTCGYSFDELLREDWYPVNRHGIVDPDMPA
jgi:hypothetical protein